MKVHCLIERVGDTPVEMGGGVRIMFQPLFDPNRKDGEPTTSVAEINSDEHLDRLFGKQWRTHLEDTAYWLTRQFKPYKQGQPVPQKKIINLSGYAIVKHQDGRAEGYRVENNNVKPKLYAGADGDWKPNAQGIVPFDTEFTAWQWLNEEIQEAQAVDIEEAQDEQATEIAKGGVTCDLCGKSLQSAVALRLHKGKYHKEG